MPASPHFVHEFASPNDVEEVHRSVVTKLAPSLETGGYHLDEHSTGGATFMRRYWPGWAISGLIVGWLAAGYGYSQSQNSIDGTVPPGVYIAAAIAVACLFIRRSEILRLTFEPRQGGTVVLIDGHASPRLQRHLREINTDGLHPDDLPRSASPTMPPPTPPAEDAVETLRRLGELRDSGVLSPQEFEQKKDDLLKRI